MAYNTDK